MYSAPYEIGPAMKYVSFGLRRKIHFPNCFLSTGPSRPEITAVFPHTVPSPNHHHHQALSNHSLDHFGSGDNYTG